MTEEGPPEPVSGSSSSWCSEGLNATIIDGLARVAVDEPDLHVHSFARVAETNKRACPNRIRALHKGTGVQRIGPITRSRLLKEPDHAHMPYAGTSAACSNQGALPRMRLRPHEKTRNADVTAFLAHLATVSEEPFTSQIRIAADSIKAYPYQITSRNEAWAMPDVSWWVSARIGEFLNARRTHSPRLARARGPPKGGPGASKDQPFSPRSRPGSTRPEPAEPRASMVVDAVAGSDTGEEADCTSSRAPTVLSKQPCAGVALQPTRLDTSPNHDVQMMNIAARSEAQRALRRQDSDPTPVIPSDKFPEMKLGKASVLESGTGKFAYQGVNPVGVGDSAERVVASRDRIDLAECMLPAGSSRMRGASVGSPVRRRRRISCSGSATGQESLAGSRMPGTLGKDTGNNVGERSRYPLERAPQGSGPPAELERHSSTIGAPRKHVLAEGSAARALLMALLDRSERGVMDFPVLIDDAAALMNGSLLSSAPDSPVLERTRKAMSLLVVEGLAEWTKKPARFRLTISGLEVARSVASRTPTAVGAAPLQKQGRVMVPPLTPAAANDFSARGTDVALPTGYPPFDIDIPPARISPDDGLTAGQDLVAGRESGEAPAHQPACGTDNALSTGYSPFDIDIPPARISPNDGPSPKQDLVAGMESGKAQAHQPALSTPSAPSAPSAQESPSMGTPVELSATRRSTLKMKNRERGSGAFETPPETHPASSPVSSAPTTAYQSHPARRRGSAKAPPRTTKTAPCWPSSQSAATAVPLSAAAPSIPQTKKRKRGSGAGDSSTGNPRDSPPVPSVPMAPYQPGPARSRSQLTYARGMGLVLVAEGLPRSRVKRAIDALLQADAPLCMDADGFCAHVRTLVAAAALPSVDLDDPVADARVAAVVLAARANAAANDSLVANANITANAKVTVHANIPASADPAERVAAMKSLHPVPANR